MNQVCGIMASIQGIALVSTLSSIILLPRRLSLVLHVHVAPRCWRLGFSLTLPVQIGVRWVSLHPVPLLRPLCRYCPLFSVGLALWLFLLCPGCLVFAASFAL